MSNLYQLQLRENGQLIFEWHVHIDELGRLVPSDISTEIVELIDFYESEQPAINEG